jgi:hypothetical protein
MTAEDNEFLRGMLIRIQVSVDALFPNDCPAWIPYHKRYSVNGFCRLAYRKFKAWFPESHVLVEMTKEDHHIVTLTDERAKKFVATIHRGLKDLREEWHWLIAK